MITMFRYITAIAGSDKPVLITGESGTGKELVAEAVHLASGRKGELVSVNMAGLDDTMFSDTLFGHRRGAFTGAIPIVPD
jgi:two-component system, NtrC family, nitrogen regulation response regulator GlnG